MWLGLSYFVQTPMLVPIILFSWDRGQGLLGKLTAAVVANALGS